jgi:hypothetical protein
MSAENFWWALTWICVLWYSSLTLYVSVKGAHDIKRMLAQLKASKRPTG